MKEKNYKENNILSDFIFTHLIWRRQSLTVFMMEHRHSQPQRRYSKVVLILKEKHWKNIFHICFTVALSLSTRNYFYMFKFKRKLKINRIQVLCSQQLFYHWKKKSTLALFLFFLLLLLFIFLSFSLSFSLLPFLPSAFSPLFYPLLIFNMEKRKEKSKEQTFG